MGEILMQAYEVALPAILGYIVWLLKQRKKSGDANSRGTMLLLRVQLIEYHDRYAALGGRAVLAGLAALNWLNKANRNYH